MKDGAADSLIESLSGGLRPFRPLAHPLLRVLPWAALTVLYVGGTAVFLNGIRPDVQQKLAEAGFLYEIIMALFIGISAAAVSAYLCVPDMRGVKWLAAVPVTAGLAFSAWIAALVVGGEAVHMPGFNHNACLLEGALMAAVPAFAMIFLSRRGATTRPLLMAAMNMLTVGALVYLALRFTCPLDAIGHILAFHILPYMAAGLAAGIFARRIYRW